MKYINVGNRISKTANPYDSRKVTALVDFKEALVKERYEDCARLLQAARNYGAKRSEIREVIDEHLRGKSGRRNGANQKSGGRRF